MTDGTSRRYELTSVRDVIYDVISSNITDPLTGQQARSSVSDWVFKSMPETAGLGKVWKFPIVIIPYSEVNDKNMTVDGSKKSIIHSIDIEVHARTRKTCDGETDVYGKTECNELIEQIKYILEVTGQSELRKAALYGPDVIGMTDDTDFLGGNKFYSKTMNLEFKRFD